MLEISAYDEEQKIRIICFQWHNDADADKAISRAKRDAKLFGYRLTDYKARSMK